MDIHARSKHKKVKSIGFYAKKIPFYYNRIIAFPILESLPLCIWVTHLNLYIYYFLFFYAFLRLTPAARLLLLHTRTDTPFLPPQLLQRPPRSHLNSVTAFTFTLLYLFRMHREDGRVTGLRARRKETHCTASLSMVERMAPKEPWRS